MTDMSISLKDGQLDWAQSRVASGEFARVEDYVIALIEQDREDEDKLAQLREAIEHGRQSGLSERSLQDIHDGFLNRRDAA